MLETLERIILTLTPGLCPHLPSGRYFPREYAAFDIGVLLNIEQIWLLKISFDIFGLHSIKEKPVLNS
jgi:hypothetical protein